MGDQRQRTRVRSKIDELPEELKEKVNALLRDTSNTYIDISLFLQQEGYEISKSSIGRYALRSSAAMERLQKAQEQAKALAEVLKKNPDIDYAEPAMQMMLGELTTRMATAQEEWDETPIDKIGKLIISANRTDTYKKKAKKDMQNKLEGALEAFKKEVYKEIESVEPELYRKIVEVADRTYNRIVKEDV